MSAKNAKVILLSGTPIINHPFELSFMLNLIRGPMKLYEFQFLKGSRIPNIELVNAILSASSKPILNYNFLFFIPRVHYAYRKY